MEKDIIILPKVPSELLQIALRDMKKTLASGITIWMPSWGEGLIGDPNCSVCFAGSVMLQTTKSHYKDLSNFGVSSSEKMDVNYAQYKFLDNIRRGNLKEAAEVLELPVVNKYIGYSSAIEDWESYSYEAPEVFFTQIEELIEFFKERGL